MKTDAEDLWSGSRGPRIADRSGLMMTGTIVVVNCILVWIVAEIVLKEREHETAPELVAFVEVVECQLGVCLGAQVCIRYEATEG